MKRARIHSWLLKTISLLLLMGLLLSNVPGRVQAAEPTKPTCKYTYTVKNNDTLNIIAKKYNVDVMKLVDANSLGDTRWIYIGSPLCIPGKTKPYSSKVPAWSNNLPGNFTAIRLGKKVIITTSNFPRNSVFFVKIANPTTDSKKMKKVGLLKTGEKNNVKGTYLVPQSLRTTPLRVCLQENALTRNNICRPVTK